MKKYLLIFSTFVWMSSFLTSTFANEPSGIHPLLSDRFVLRAGMMFSHYDGKVALDSKEFDGTPIDLQDDLGFDENQTLWSASFRWRITDRSQLQFLYFNKNQSNRDIAEKTIDWGDLEFQAGVSIDTELDVSLLRAFYGYSLFKTPQAEFGLGAGLHLLDLKAEMKGIASLNSVVIKNEVYRSESADLLAPLPNLGIYGGYAFSPKWYVRGYADWFSANTGDYSGSLTGLGVNVEYQAFKNVGFGLGYQYLNINIKVDTHDWKGKADYTNNGPVISMTVNF